MDSTVNDYPTLKVPVSVLPSGGKSYPSRVEINYRGYTFGELQNLNTSKGMHVLEILSKALDGFDIEGMSKTDLTFPDCTYLSILRKLSSIGANDVEIRYVCGASKCGHVNSHVFTQMDIQFTDMEFEGKSIEMELSNGKSYSMSPMTIGDAQMLKSGSLSKYHKDKDLLRDKVALLAIMCRNHSFDETYSDFSRTTDAKDYDALEDIEKMFYHDIKPLTATCSKCGRNNTVSLEGREQLIMPFRERGKTDRNRFRVVPRDECKPLPLEEDGVQRSDEVRSASS